MVLALPHPQLRVLSSKRYVLLKGSVVSDMMGNDILSLNEAQKPDRGVVNIFHLAFVMVLLKMEVSSSFFNLDLWPCESSLP